MYIQESADGKLNVLVPWKGLSPKKETPEPLQRVLEDIPKLLQELLDRRYTAPDL